MNNAEQRHMLNELCKKTFWFDFEGWVVNGYFEGDYIPYSFVEDGRMLSNVSVNRMQFIQNGVRRDYIQLGTVMTDEANRNRGLAGKLIDMVLERYRDKCGGVYLFGNMEALGFYRRLGFSEMQECRYTLRLGFSPAAHDEALFDAVPYDGADDYRLFYCGKDVDSIEKQRLYFPSLSHA